MAIVKNGVNYSCTDCGSVWRGPKDCDRCEGIQTGDVVPADPPVGDDTENTEDVAPVKPKRRRRRAT